MKRHHPSSCGERTWRFSCTWLVPRSGGGPGSTSYGLLWGGKPECHSLNEALRVLRRCGGDDLFWSNGRQVALLTEAVTLDRELLQRRLEEEEWEEAAALVASAPDLVLVEHTPAYV